MIDISCEWMVLCSQVIQDTRNNALSLINCLETISANEFPAAHPGFAFAARYRRNTDSEHPDHPVDLEYRLVRWSAEQNDGEEEQIIVLPGTWLPQHARGNVFINFRAIRLFAPGRIWFRVDHRPLGGEWVPGGVAALDVTELAIPPGLRERVESLKEEFAAAKASKKSVVR